MFDISWFRARNYRHFDYPVALDDLEFLVAPDAVAKHSFKPLIHYIDGNKRYKADDRKTVVKPRPIMYASHADAAVLGYYSHKLNALLSTYYGNTGLGESVIAYRALGKGNYDFSAEALAFAKSLGRCSILAFDVTGFFDNIPHNKLKNRLKKLLETDELTPDWYNIFRAITKFRYINIDDLKANSVLKARLESRSRLRLATVAELKKYGIEFRKNGSQFKTPRVPNKAGVPQGTPISASISNAFMIEFDTLMLEYCNEIGAMYRRYSDDVLVICPPEHAKGAEERVRALLAAEELQVSEKKTEITDFDISSISLSGSRSAQYLGFSFYPDGVAIRSSSISRQACKIRKSITRAKKAAARGTGVLHTRKLRKRFSLIFDVQGQRPIRNFSSYAMRSALAFDGGAKIRAQAMKLQRLLDKEIAKAKSELI